MSATFPSKVQRDVLSAVYRLTQELSAAPSALQIAPELAAHLSEDQVRELLQDLVRAKRLAVSEGRFALTDAGLDYLRNLEGTSADPGQGAEASDPLPTSPRDTTDEEEKASLGSYVQIAGEVKAGDVDLYELRGDAGEWLPIAQANYGNRVVGYKVVGRSMEQERIYEGDYLLVELYCGSGWPSDGETIVTRYQPIGRQPRAKADEAGYAEMVGPTVKVFHEIPSPRGPEYWLSSKKARASNPYAIKTYRIAPIGRVIAVYRPMRPYSMRKA